jgi:selenide,water dikinase
LEEAWPLVQRGIYPGGTKRNLEHFGSSVQWSQGTSKETQLVLADPQTSGGLLVAIAPEDVDEFLSRLSAASVIGEITATPPGVVQVDAP